MAARIVPTTLATLIERFTVAPWIAYFRKILIQDAAGVPLSAYQEGQGGATRGGSNKRATACGSGSSDSYRTLSVAMSEPAIDPRLSGPLQFCQDNDGAESTHLWVGPAVPLPEFVGDLL